MPREVVALVSADDAIAGVRVHADRVHDLLRRSGCGPEESVEVTESYAFALLDTLVHNPASVGDMAGWWFGRALELGRRLGEPGADDADAPDATASVLSGTSGEAQVRVALATLPEAEREAVLLRDAYDLPLQAVAVALRRDETAVAGLVGVGRLRLLARYDDRTPLGLAAHNGRAPADIAQLTALADNLLPAARAVPLRRHIGACLACEAVVDALTKARRLTAALPIVAMPDEAREAMLERVAIRAASTLPSVDEVLAAVDEDDDSRPAIPPVAIVFAIVLALLLGVAVALATRSATNGTLPGSTAPAQSAAPVEPSFSLSPSPRPTPTGSVSRSARPSVRPTPAQTATPSSRSSAPAAAPAITLEPASGPTGTQITVLGAHWRPGDVVTVVYTASFSGSRATVTVGPDGTFTASATADALVPGAYAVQADGTGESASASFRQTS